MLPTHPIKFLLETINVLFEEYQDVCQFLASEWNDSIYSESPCCIPISFCSREYMGWKMLLL